MWKKIKSLKDHNSKITCLIINDYLNILASGCVEGRINLYTIPKFEIYRTINLNNFTRFDKPLIPNKIFISSSPLPSISVYSSTNKVVHNFSINGKELNFENLNASNDYNKNEEVYFSDINKDDNLEDNIIVSASAKKFEIKKFPNFETIKTFDVLKRRDKDTSNNFIPRNITKISNLSIIYYEFTTNSIYLKRIPQE